MSRSNHDPKAAAMKRLPTLSCLLVTSLAVAQPATTNAPKPDLSSPRATLLSAYTAIHDGDIPSAKACMLFHDPDQAEHFELNLTQTFGPFRLMRAMEARFGEAGRAPFANATLDKNVDHLLSLARDADFQLDGNTATVINKKAQVNPSAETEITGITLEKQPGSPETWKIQAASFSDYTSDIPTTQLPLLRTLRNAILSSVDATIARMNRGDFQSPDEAYAAYLSCVRAATSSTTAKSH
jgi:hypothetical protein